MPGGLGRRHSHLPAVTLPPARVGSGPLTHMGGFFGSPWNFIFLDEFAAAGGARISLSSLCEDTRKGHARSTPHPEVFLRPAPCHQCLRNGGRAGEQRPDSSHLGQAPLLRSAGLTTTT